MRGNALRKAIAELAKDQCVLDKLVSDAKKSAEELNDEERERMTDVGFKYRSFLEKYFRYGIASNIPYDARVDFDG